MIRASIVVDLRHMRCGYCEVTLQDELTRVCPTCGAVFDSITSNRAGLAAKLKRRREAAGVHQCYPRLMNERAGSVRAGST